MRRMTLAFVLVIAAAIACEPLIHTHPLDQKAQSSCAICVNAVARVASLSPAPIAPQKVVAVLSLPDAGVAVVRAATPLASRAPPSI